jgi:AraC-like DNA-binding protein
MERLLSMRIWSTEALAVDCRFPYWADVVCRTFVALDCDRLKQNAFQAAIQRRTLGGLSIADIRADAQRVVRSAALLAMAPSDNLILALQIEGGGSVAQGENESLLQPGRAVLVDTALPYRFEFADCFRQVVLKIPRQFLADAIGEPELNKCFGRALSGSSGAGRLLHRLALATLAEDETAADEAEGIALAMAHLASAAIRSRWLPPPEEDGTLTLRWVAALDFVDCNLPNAALDRVMIAAALGISIRSLTRLFALNGATVEQIIWDKRLQACRAELSDERFADEKITDVALKWGFSSSAHFSRRFRARYGMRPTDLRRRGPVFLHGKAE